MTLSNIITLIYELGLWIIGKWMTCVIVGKNSWKTGWSKTTKTRKNSNEGVNVKWYWQENERKRKPRHFSEKTKLKQKFQKCFPQVKNLSRLKRKISLVTNCCCCKPKKMKIFTDTNFSFGFLHNWRNEAKEIIQSRHVKLSLILQFDIPN